MHWALLSLTSALFLGGYDIFQKHSLRHAPVLAVLLVSTATSASLWGGVLLLQHAAPGALPALLWVPPLGLRGHLELLFKSALVACSWLCSYLAVKHLPISLAAPIRSTGPLWTTAAAIAFLGERPSALQLVGVAITLLSFLGLSLVGRLEGVRFHRDRWVGFMLLGTLLGTCSGLYDKLLLSRLMLAPATVQAWFSIYLFVLIAPLAAFGFWRSPGRGSGFRFRFSMPLVAVCLLCADFAYFSALREPGGLISLVASIRRGSTLIAFGAGVLLFGEKNGLKKLPPVLGILLGIGLTLLG